MFEGCGGFGIFEVGKRCRSYVLLILNILDLNHLFATNFTQLIHKVK